MLRASSFVLALAAVLALPIAASAQAGGGAGGSAGGGGGVTFGGGASATAPTPAPAPTDATPATAPAAGGDEAQPPAGDTGAAEGDEAAEAAEWAERDRLVNEADTLTGGVGLLRTQHAQSGAPGQFRLAFNTEWFSAGFLCTGSFNCPNPGGGAPLTSDTLNHIGATMSLGMSLFKIGPGTFEGYTSTSGFANSDTANRPTLLQVLGDTNFGIKYVLPISKVFWYGAAAELWLINGTGAVGLDGNGTSAKFDPLIFTMDMRGFESHIPLRFSFNALYTVDNTGDVVGPTEAPTSQGGRGQPVTRIERYGLGVNRVDHFDLFLGGEFFAADERVRPFLEGHILAANNRQGYACHTTNPSGDHCLATDGVVPATLTIGGRFYPWKKGFSLLAALDIGLGGTSDFIEELQPVPPWTLFIGAGWGIDVNERPPVVKTKMVEKVVEKAPPPRGKVTGFVHEKDKTDPIVGAIASYRDHPDMTPLATGADGKFADEVPAGNFTYDIKADGYKPGSCDAAMPKEGGNVNIDCPLEALPRVGSVVGHVRDAETSQPVSGVRVLLTDSQHKRNNLNTDASGGFKFENVAPGAAEINITADGYLVLVTPADVKVRTENNMDLLLRPIPKQPKVVLTTKEVIIKEQIQFALDSAVILPESFGILTEIADTIIRHPELTSIEVQGHTDNSGTPEHNKLLSDQRAEAVRAWLVQHGVGGDRLIARGYGQDKPLVPNVTAQNRSRNRRVQLIILSNAGGGLGGGAGGAGGAIPPAPPPAPKPKPAGF
jgi:outer membrane protein OmpA-like peptidoglycan-associated protein